jgi:hypothetical protein
VVALRRHAEALDELTVCVTERERPAAEIGQTISDLVG